jgi:hypothetical protein
MAQATRTLRFADFLADAPVTRIALANLTATAVRLTSPSILITGPGDGSEVTLKFGLDASLHTDPAKSLIFGWEISEDGGATWQLLVQTTDIGGDIVEGADTYKYRWCCLSSRPIKSFSFRARVFLSSVGGPVSIPAVSFWKI